MSNVTIYTDDDCDMMKITFGENVVFEGNFWDLQLGDSRSLKEFLQQLNLKVKTEDYTYE